MSVWNEPILQEPVGDSPWIKNDYFAQKRVLKFVDVMTREQPENTQDKYKTPDGKELMFVFMEPLTNAEKKYTTRSAKGALPKAMKAAGIELNDFFEAQKQGEGIDMTFIVNKVRDDGTVIVPEEKAF